jgi:hypothetical protein
MGMAPFYADPNQDPARDSIDGIDGDRDANIPFELTRRGAVPAPASGVALRANERPPQSTDPALHVLWSHDPAGSTPRKVIVLADSLAETLAAVHAATNRDAIFKLLLEGIHPVAPRVGVFAVKRGVLVGWTCSPEAGDEATFRATQIIPPPKSVLVYALLAEDVVVTSIPDDPLHAALQGAMRAPIAGDVAIAAVRVAKKPVALVLADGWSDAVRASNYIQQVASAAGAALARLVRERRK